MLPVALWRYRARVSWAFTSSLVIASAFLSGAPEEPREESTESLAAQAQGPEGPVPAWQLWHDYVRIQRPAHRGTGLMIAAGVTFGIGLAAQVGDIALNDGQGEGFAERLFIGPSFVLAPLGGFFRGRDDAFVDASVGRHKKSAKTIMIAGFALAGIGAVGGLVNEALWWQCQIGERGPYKVEPPEDVLRPVNVCRSGIARLGLDVSALMLSGGLGMGLWALKYRKDSKTYERAVIAVVPQLQRSQVGFGIVGSF